MRKTTLVARQKVRLIVVPTLVLARVEKVVACNQIADATLLHNTVDHRVNKHRWPVLPFFSSQARTWATCGRLPKASISLFTKWSSKTNPGVAFGLSWAPTGARAHETMRTGFKPAAVVIVGLAAIVTIMPARALAGSDERDSSSIALVDDPRDISNSLLIGYNHDYVDVIAARLTRNGTQFSVVVTVVDTRKYAENAREWYVSCEARSALLNLDEAAGQLVSQFSSFPAEGEPRVMRSSYVVQEDGEREDLNATFSLTSGAPGNLSWSFDGELLGKSSTTIDGLRVDCADVFSPQGIPLPFVNSDSAESSENMRSAPKPLSPVMTATSETPQLGGADQTSQPATATPGLNAGLVFVVLLMLGRATDPFKNR